MTRFCGHLFLALALFYPAIALSQDVDAEPDQDSIICVVPLTVWRPTPEDNASIRSRPVPDSFAAAYNSGPCNTLYKDGLLDWHLAFGNEQTTSAALAFYRHQLGRHAVPVEQFPGELDAAWQKVCRMQATFEDRADEDARNSEPTTPHASSVRLQSLLYDSERYDYVLDLHIRAANFFRSPRLLEEANPYLEAVEARNDLLNEHFDVLRAAGVNAPGSWDSFDGRSTTRINPYKRASLRYRTLAEEADFDALRREAVGPYNEAIAEFSDLAWQNPKTRDINNTRYDALKQAYEKKNNFAEFAIRVLREDVLLDLSREPHRADPHCTVDNFSETLIWLRHLERRGDDEGQPMPYNGSFYPRNYRDKSVELLLAKAQCHLSSSKQSAMKGDDREADKQVSGAFKTLDQARQLVQADESPARFSQIANLYLDTAKFCRSLKGDEQYDGLSRADCNFDINLRLETYFRVNLDALNTIATAARSPR